MFFVCKLNMCIVLFDKEILLKNKEQCRVIDIEFSDILNVLNLRKYIMKVNILIVIFFLDSIKFFWKK